MDTKCTYCGFESDLQREHVIPAVWFGHRTYEASEQWIVPACKQCNSYAGANVFFSIPEKAKHILKRYRSRAAGILRTAFWSDDELAGLGRVLRAQIEESIKTKQLILRRIAYLESITEMDINYMRPEWVEKKMKAMQAEYNRLIKQQKRREKNWLQKQGSKTAQAYAIKT